MISTVWRVKAGNFDSKEFIAKYELDPDTVSEDGFNLCLFEAPSKDHFIQNLSDALKD